MGAPSRTFSKEELKAIRADRAAGASVRDLEIRYKTSGKTLMKYGVIELGRRDKASEPPKKKRRKRKPKGGTIEVLNAALRASQEPTPGPFLLTHANPHGSDATFTEEHPTLEAALAACVRLRMEGAQCLELWKRVPYRIEAIVEGA